MYVGSESQVGYLVLVMKPRVNWEDLLTYRSTQHRS